MSLNLLVNQGVAQEVSREYLNMSGEPCKKGNAVMLRVVSRLDDNIYVEELVYIETKRPMAVTLYQTENHQVKHGPYTRYKSSCWRVKKGYDEQPIDKSGFYKNDLKDGTWVEFSEYGTDTVSIKNYTRDTLNGVYKEFLNGSVNVSGNYILGVKEGVWETHDNKGNLVEKGTYVSGERNGKWIFLIGETRIEGAYNKTKKVGEWNAYYQNRRKKRTCFYTDDGKKDSIYLAWYSDGTLSDSGAYDNGKKVGVWKYYFESGKISEYALHRYGEKDSIVYWNRAGEVITEQNIYWEDASFPGGEMAMYEFVSRNVEYPREALENGIEGIVYVQFVVGIDGELSEINPIRSPDELLSKEAIRLVERMPPWLPAKIHTKVQRVKFTLPIHFRLG